MFQNEYIFHSNYEYNPRSWRCLVSYSFISIENENELLQLTVVCNSIDSRSWIIYIDIYISSVSHFRCVQSLFWAALSTTCLMFKRVIVLKPAFMYSFEWFPMGQFHPQCINHYSILIHRYENAACGKKITQKQIEKRMFNFTVSDQTEYLFWLCIKHIYIHRNENRCDIYDSVIDEDQLGYQWLILLLDFELRTRFLCYNSYPLLCYSFILLM